MARAVFPHEITDPDFQWLINTYCESHPGSFRLDSNCLPVVIITGNESLSDSGSAFQQDPLLALPPGSTDEADQSPPPKK